MLSQTKGRIRVLVVEDHALVRQGLRSILEAEADLELVAESDGDSASVEWIQSLKPDVLLLDLSLGGSLRGLDLARSLKQECPNIAIVILTMHDSETYLLEALEAGVEGYILKDAPTCLIPLALRASLQGGVTVHKSLLRKGLQTMHMTPKPEVPPGMNSRDLQLLKLIATGRSTRAMAQELHLAETTVKKYVHNLLGKLGVKDRAQAAVLALRRGIVS